jgi:hypothetical protein
MIDSKDFNLFLLTHDELLIYILFSPMGFYGLWAVPLKLQERLELYPADSI